MGDRLAMPKLILGQMRWLDTLINGKVRPSQADSSHSVAYLFLKLELVYARSILLLFT